MDVDGALAVVTGAASGIGRALALRLYERGASLVLADVDGERLGPLATTLDAVDVVADVADPDAMDRLAEIAAEASLVCLNAGVTSMHSGPVWEAPPEEWDRVMGVNLGGVVNGLRSFVPRLIDRAEPSAVLVTASLAGLVTWPGGGPYAASKHAIITVAEQAALALAASRVKVTVLCPALVRTGMSEVGDDPFHVADRALQAVVDGRFLVMDDEWRAALPERARRLATGESPQIPKPGGRFR